MSRTACNGQWDAGQPETILTWSAVPVTDSLAFSVVDLEESGVTFSWTLSETGYKSVMVTVVNDGDSQSLRPRSDMVMD